MRLGSWRGHTKEIARKVMKVRGKMDLVGGLADVKRVSLRAAARYSQLTVQSVMRSQSLPRSLRRKTMARCLFVLPPRAQFSRPTLHCSRGGQLVDIKNLEPHPPYQKKNRRRRLWKHSDA